MEEKLVNRIRKMLALANDSAATEHERDTALSMVYKLLAKHNLSMSDIGSGDPARAPEEKRQQNSGHFYGRPWALQVCQAVAKLFFCEYFLMRSHERNMVHHYFVGKESNSITAMEMAKFLIESVRREARRRQRELNENMTWQRSFCLGAASKLWHRVEAVKAETVKESVPGTALVLANLYDTEREANRGFIAEQGIVLKEGSDRSKKSVKMDAYSDGQRYGDTLNLNTQLGA